MNNSLLEVEIDLSDIPGFQKNEKVTIKVDPYNQNYDEINQDIIEQLTNYCNQYDQSKIDLLTILTVKNHFYRISSQLVNEIKIHFG